MREVLIVLFSIFFVNIFACDCWNETVKWKPEGYIVGADIGKESSSVYLATYNELILSKKVPLTRVYDNVIHAAYDRVTKSIVVMNLARRGYDMYITGIPTNNRTDILCTRIISDSLAAVVAHNDSVYVWTKFIQSSSSTYMKKLKSNCHSEDIARLDNFSGHDAVLIDDTYMCGYCSSGKFSCFDLEGNFVNSVKLESFSSRWWSDIRYDNVNGYVYYYMSVYTPNKDIIWRIDVRNIINGIPVIKLFDEIGCSGLYRPFVTWPRKNMSTMLFFMIDGKAYARDSNPDNVCEMWKSEKSPANYKWEFLFLD